LHRFAINVKKKKVFGLLVGRAESTHAHKWVFYCIDYCYAIFLLYFYKYFSAPCKFLYFGVCNLKYIFSFVFQHTSFVMQKLFFKLYHSEYIYILDCVIHSTLLILYFKIYRLKFNFLYIEIQNLWKCI